MKTKINVTKGNFEICKIDHKFHKLKNLNVFLKIIKKEKFLSFQVFINKHDVFILFLKNLQYDLVDYAHECLNY